MANYDLDNAGSGFNLEDDEDLEAMLDRASAASEDDEGDSPSVSQPEALEIDDLDFDDTDEESQPEPEPEPAPATPPAKTREPVRPAATRRPRVGTPQPAARPKAEPKAEEKPVVEESATKPRVRVPSEADQLLSARRTIAVLDAYRKLNEIEKSITVQFVTNSDQDEADDATVVVKVLNADPKLMETMKALCEVYELEPVERAFFTMGLDTSMLHSLGELVTVFTSNDYDQKKDNLAYSRDVVAGISTLEDRVIGFVKATESVLAAAKID